MNSEEIFEKVKKIIVDQLGVPEANITLSSSFIDDLGADAQTVRKRVRPGTCSGRSLNHSGSPPARMRLCLLRDAADCGAGVPPQEKPRTNL